MATKSLGTVDFSKILGTGPDPTKVSNARRSINVQAAIDSAVAQQANTLGEVDALAVHGDRGAKAAQSALNRILNAPGYSQHAKNQAKQFYKSGGGDLDHSPLDTIRDAVGHTFSEIFHAIDIPKRAVVASVDEALSAVDPQYDNDASWMENVFKKPRYGFGDVIQNVVNDYQKNDPNDLAAKLLANPAVKDTLGLVGDVGLDPLSYAGVGVVKDVAQSVPAVEKGAQLADIASKAKTGKSIEEGASHIRQVRKALAQVSGSAGRKSLNVTSDEALKQAARLRRFDIVDKLRLGHGLGKLSAKDLADLGYRGGIRFGQSGRVLVPWEVTRHFGAPFRGAGAIYEKLGLGGEARKLFGSKELGVLRKMIRDPAVSGERAANAVLAQDAIHHINLGEEIVTHAFGPELHDLSKQVAKGKIDHGLLGEALVGGDAAARAEVESKAPGLLEKFDNYIKDMGDRLNARVGEGKIATSFRDEGAMPVMFDREARQFLKSQRAGEVLTQPGKDLSKLSEETIRNAGGIFSQIGTDEFVAKYGTNLADQLEGAVRELGYQGDKMYETDILKLMARQLRSNAHTVGEWRGLQSLRDAGVLQASADHEADLTAAQGHIQELIDGLITTHDAVNKSSDLAATAVDDAIKGYKDNLRVLRKASQTTEAAYDAAREAGASPAKLRQLRSAMMEAGGAKLDAVKQLRFLQKQAGSGADLLERRLGTVQAALRPSLGATVDDLGATGAKKLYTEVAPLAFPSDEAVKIMAAPADALAEVTDRLDQVAAALDETPLRNVNKRVLLTQAEEARGHAQYALQFLVDHPDLPDKTRAAVALQATAHETEARFAEMGQRVLTDDEMIQQLETETARRTISTLGAQHMKQYGRDFEEADKGVIEAFVNSYGVFQDPDELSKFTKAYRATTRAFKTFAMLSPGFSIRNSMGAFFNNYVDNIDTSSYLIFGHEFKKFYGGWAAAAVGKETQAIERVSPEWRGVFQTMLDNGQFADANRILGEVNRNIEKDVGESGGKRVLTDWRLTRGSRRINERVEQYHRGALMFDTLRKGGTFEQGLDRVYKFHFNYGDLSTAEQHAREIIPFYTWTSRNLPLQLEMAIRNPRMYQRVNEIRAALTKDNKSTLIPDYIRQSLTAVHLGGGAYLTPDLPYANVDEQLTALVHNPISLVAQNAAPAVRVPLELGQGSRFFGNIPFSGKLAPAPGLEGFIAKTPGIKQLLQSMNLVKYDKSGKLLMNDKTSYAIESFLPSFAQVRRLFPNEPKYNARVFGAWLGYFGLGEHTVDATDRTSEAYRRADKLSELVDQLKGQGVIPPS